MESQSSLLSTASRPSHVRIPAALAQVGCGRSKLYALCKAGQLELVRVAGNALITQASIDALLAAAEPASTAHSARFAKLRAARVKSRDAARASNRVRKS